MHNKNPRKQTICIDRRASTLQRHKDCKEHKDAVNEKAMRDTFSNCFLSPCLHVSLHECKTTLKKKKTICLSP